MVDWLLAQVEREHLKSLEIYTFGNAANHYNNPQRAPEYGRDGALLNEPNQGIIGHIEHYANADDFVARWGVLKFTIGEPPVNENVFTDAVFVRSGGGHLLNQHYLSRMFPFNSENKIREPEFGDYMWALLEKNE